MGRTEAKTETEKDYENDEDFGRFLRDRLLREDDDDLEDSCATDCCVKMMKIWNFIADKILP